jgi:hypothetical protein
MCWPVIPEGPSPGDCTHCTLGMGCLSSELAVDIHSDSARSKLVVLFACEWVNQSDVPSHAYVIVHHTVLRPYPLASLSS